MEYGGEDPEATYSRRTYHYAQGWKVHSQTSALQCTVVVQVMSTVETDGKLVSMTLSDGVYVSANIIPEDGPTAHLPGKV